MCEISLMSLIKDGQCGQHTGALRPNMPPSGRHPQGREGDFTVCVCVSQNVVNVTGPAAITVGDVRRVGGRTRRTYASALRLRRGGWVDGVKKRTRRVSFASATFAPPMIATKCAVRRFRTMTRGRDSSRPLQHD